MCGSTGLWCLVVGHWTVLAAGMLLPTRLNTHIFRVFSLHLFAMLRMLFLYTILNKLFFEIDGLRKTMEQKLNLPRVRSSQLRQFDAKQELNLSTAVAKF